MADRRSKSETDGRFVAQAGPENRRERHTPLRQDQQHDGAIMADDHIANPYWGLIDGPQDIQLGHVPGHLLRRCQQRAVDIFEEEVGSDGPTPRQFAVMVTICQNPGINQTEVVQRTGIDRSTIGDLVARLVKRGLVRRRRTDQDARANALFLTQEGAALLERVAPAIDRVQRRIVSLLPDGEREVFLRCLKRLAGLPDKLQ